MRCPTLTELPPPPPGRTGWPWTEESPQLPDTMPDSRPWPRVSIVTPSYNQAQFIEETIRSVLLRCYPDLEYIIIDGGSTDGSVEIIRKYAPWLAYWVSEPDRGQSHAINKGFERATGEIVAWLNSDDTYQPGALQIVGWSFRSTPDLDVLYSECNFIDERSRIIGQSLHGPYNRAALILRDRIPQPTAFIRASTLMCTGYLDESLHYAMDYDLWLRIALRGILCRSDQIFANFRYHDASKSRSRGLYFWPDVVQAYEKLFSRNDLPPDVVGLRRQAIREAAWRAATAFYRAGVLSRARQYALQAEHGGLFEEDLAFASQHLLYDEACSNTQQDLCDLHWILELV